MSAAFLIRQMRNLSKARHDHCLTQLSSLPTMQRYTEHSATLELPDVLPLEQDTFDKNGSVLLLEDDPEFKDVMKDYLASNGFQVASVQNGVEGVHEVLAHDFDVILCDMMMPTLPGDMFFRAVERMRPHLCNRFIFMTGHRGNPKVTDFIRTVNGTMLSKPFHVEDLLEMIAFVRVRAAVN
jgi:CheY-like chemotaxis protein